jgi:site-specific DNA-methyltransferase (adenine-specific)
MTTTLIHADALEALRGIEDNSVDSIVTDPPYGLSFMGRKWDYDVPSVEIWKECLRVLKPGGHLLSFAGTRTHHRMVVNIEDAGFEIRDMIAWVYGSGFPKNLDISKAIDKAEGAEREVVEWRKSLGGRTTAAAPMNRDAGETNTHDPVTAPATDKSRQWEGWGTALKPAFEPICVARKPISEKNVAKNVLKWYTGAMNINASRVPGAYETRDRATEGGNSMFDTGAGGGAFVPRSGVGEEGRWPANLIHDGSEEVLEQFPDSRSGVAVLRNGGGGKIFNNRNTAGPQPDSGYTDSGSAARFFYCAKASPLDRNEGLDSITGRMRNDGRMTNIDNPYQRGRVLKNHHPTVKPTKLMQYLVRLVTPPDGVVLDPFMGSGSTGKAAVLEGFHFIGIERENEYVELATARINYVKGNSSESN